MTKQEHADRITRLINELLDALGEAVTDCESSILGEFNTIDELLANLDKEKDNEG